jgi:uncharacterized protein YeaO (DUF488 family)
MMPEVSRIQNELKERYANALAARPQAVAALRQQADGSRLTLVYGARDEGHNNVVALNEYLQRA